MDEHLCSNRGACVAITRRGTFATGVQLHPCIVSWRRRRRENWERWWRGGRRLGSRKRGKGKEVIEGQGEGEGKGGKRKRKGGGKKRGER